MFKINYPCIVCDKKIEDTDKKFIVALEVPYLNLWMHRECYGNVEEFLLEFLKENLEKWIKCSIKS